MQHTTSRQRGFTLGELFAVLVILSVTAAFLYPVVIGHGASKERNQRNQCMSNLKQVGLALLSYAQDNDETFPPIVSKETYTGHLLPAFHAPNGSLPPKIPQGMRLPAANYWLGQLEQIEWKGGRTGGHFDMGIKGFLSPYFNNATVVWCATPLPNKQYPVYMTNDLAGGAALSHFANPSVTVAAMDGELIFPTAGHAHESTARLNAWMKESRQPKGGMVGEAANRHNGGATYLLADGHVKWFKPDVVFFPPRNSISLSHFDSERREYIGPNPGGPMDLTGVPYQATFHPW